MPLLLIVSVVWTLAAWPPEFTDAFRAWRRRRAYLKRMEGKTR